MPTLEDNDSKIDNSYAEGRGGYSSHPDNDGSSSSNEARKLQGLEQNLHNSDDPTQENDNIQNTRNKEAGGSWTTDVTPGSTQSGMAGGLGGRAARFFSTKKGKGATAGVIGGVGVIGILFSLFGPMSLVISLTENLLDTNDAAQTSFQRRITKVLGMKMSGDSTFCDNASTRKVKCKMGRMTTKGFQKIAKKGVVAFDSDGNNLSKSKGKYPNKTVSYYEVDGEKIQAKDIKQHLANNPKLAAKLLGRSGAFNVRFDVWRGKYFKQNFYDRWKISRSGGIADGENKKNSTLSDINEKIKSKLPSNENLNSKTQAKVKANTDKMVSQGKKGGIAYLSAVGGCVAVKLPEIITYGVAATQAARLMPLISDVVLSPGGKNKAFSLSNYTPEDAEVIGKLLTETDSDGNTATDSPLFQNAFGINKNKTGVSKEFSPGYNLLTNPTLQDMRDVSDDSKASCNVILSPQAMYTAATANAITTVAASTTIIGGILKVGVEFAVSEAAAYAIGKAAGAALGAVIDDLAKNDELDKVLGGQGGKKMGDALGISAMIFFSSGSASRHIPVLKQSQLTAYSEVKSDQVEFQRSMDLASLSPFDTSSKYTFLGSIVNNINMAVLSHGGYSTSSIASLTLSPLRILSPSLYASDKTENDCGYAEEFGMEAKDDMTPAVNAAGLPCYGYIGNMASEEAVSIATGGNAEGKSWVDDDVDEEATLDEIASNDSRLADYIDGCGAASIDSGEWNNTAAGCTITGGSSGGSVKGSLGCDNTETDASICSDTSVGETKLKSSGDKDSEAVAAFAMDYQISQSIDGYDDEPTTASLDGKSELNVMTYNIAGKFGGWGVDRKKEAAHGVVDVINNEKQPDIIAMQEVIDEQRAILDNGLTEYSRAKSAASRDIYFKKDIFEIVKGSREDLCFVDDDGSNNGQWTDCNRMLLIKLRVKSTQKEFYVASIHPDSRSSSNRLESAKRLVGKSTSKYNYSLANKSEPVIIAGDMNDNHNTNGSKYLMENGFDLSFQKAITKTNDDCESANNGTGQDCGKKNPRIIDHIYISSSINATINSWENIKNNSSDHNPIMINVNIPGILPSEGNSSSQVNTDGYAFPVDMSGLNSGIKVNQTTTIHHGDGKYKAFDLMSDDNTNVFAIYNGTISKVNKSYKFTNGSGKACQSITLKADDGYYYWYGHVKGSTVNQGDKVKAGQKIAEVAGRDQYNPTCFGGGPHLHIDRDKLWGNIGGSGNGGDPAFIPFLSKLYQENGGK